MEILNFCTIDLSSLYFDIRKDCLYCDDIESLKRKNCIIILKSTLYFLMKWLNPILVFTIEEVFQTLKSNELNTKKDSVDSIFLFDFKEINTSQDIKFDSDVWDILEKIKIDINQIIEKMRNDKVIKSGLETKIFINADKKYDNIFKQINLSDFLVCSSVELNNEQKKSEMITLNDFKDINVLVEKATGKKCDHCWRVSNSPCERKNCAIK